jgi:hypothetical protein
MRGIRLRIWTLAYIFVNTCLFLKLFFFIDAKNIYVNLALEEWLMVSSLFAYISAWAIIKNIKDKELSLKSIGGKTVFYFSFVSVILLCDSILTSYPAVMHFFTRENGTSTVIVYSKEDSYSKHHCKLRLIIGKENSFKEIRLCADLNFYESVNVGDRINIFGLQSKYGAKIESFEKSKF